MVEGPKYWEHGFGYVRLGLLKRNTCLRILMAEWPKKMIIF